MNDECERMTKPEERGEASERRFVIYEFGLPSSSDIPSFVIFSQLTHLPPSEVRIGNSSIINCVLPIAPIIWVPVALNHFFDMLSPVWQPQLLMNASRPKILR